MFEELAKLIEKSVKEDVEGKEVAVAFSGGVDSTLMAFLSKKYAKSVKLYTISFPDKEDLIYAKRIAPLLGLEHRVYLLNNDEARHLYLTVESKLHLGFLKSEILAPLEKLFEIVEEKYVVFGAASEELFLGYERYYKWIEEGIDEEEINKRLIKEYHILGNGGDIWAIDEIGKSHSKISLFPLYKDYIKDIAFSIPLAIRAKDKERKKHVIREVARYFGIPEIAINRKKRALQYGTGIHKKLLKMKKKGIIE